MMKQSPEKVWLVREVDGCDFFVLYDEDHADPFRTVVTLLATTSKRWQVVEYVRADVR